MRHPTIGSKPARSSAMRTVGWLAVASMLAVALLGPTAGSALAGTTITNPPGNPTCADLGYSLSFKIDTGQLEEKTYTASTQAVETNWDGQEITLDNISDDGQTFDWSSTLPVSAVLVKAASDNNALYTYDPAVTSDAGLTRGAGQQGISHLLFCGNEEEPSEEPPSEPPSEEPPSEEPPSEPPAGSEEPTGSEPPAGSEEPTGSEEPSFSGGVNPITGAPSVATTLPPTDAIGIGAQPGSDTWRVLLVVMATLLASILVLTPNRSSVRR